MEATVSFFYFFFLSPPPFFFPSCFASPERNRLNVILTLNGGKRGEAMRAEKENPFAAVLSAP